MNDGEESTQINEELEEVISNISEVCADEREKLMSHFWMRKGDPMENLSQMKMWNLKKKLIPKIAPEMPSAVRDTEGNLVTQKEEIKNILVENFKERLLPNEMEDELKDLEKLKEKLYEIRYELAKE